MLKARSTVASGERYGGGPCGQEQGTVLAREACGAPASGLEEGERGIDPDDDVLPS